MKDLEVLKFEKDQKYQICVHHIWVHPKEVVLKMEKLHVLLSLVLSLLPLFVLFYFSQSLEERNRVIKKKTRHNFKNN